MTNLFATYQQDILDLFKFHYKKLINKNIQVHFEEVLSLTLSELQLNKASSEDIHFLKCWYECIHLQNFLLPFLGEDFTEMILHSHQSAQLIKKDGRKEIPIENLSEEDLQLGLEVLALKNNIQWNYKEPFASFNLEVNHIAYRCTLIHSSTSANQKSKLFLRSILNFTPTLEIFALRSDVHHLLIELMISKKNVLISGGTGSGKTTLMRSLLGLIPRDEHLIVLEDTHEILNTHPGQTSFLADKEQKNKSLKDYCAYSLRMSPDRLIVGEMRSTEVVPFLLAMNTGHKGLMSTIHASSAVDAIVRISMLFSLFSESRDISYSLITKLVCKNIDYVIHMEDKKIKEICRIIGSESETPFYERVFEA